MAKLSRRTKLINRMRGRIGKGKGRLHGIAKAGARPMAAFGNMVMGMSDAELLRFSRSLASTATPTARCSLTGKLAVNTDPAWAEATGPAAAWAAEVWRLSVGDARCVGAKVLAGAWRAASLQTGSWSRSVGPARRCLLTLGRM